jgi:cytochrome c oxidase cbb3-type subunit 2
MIPESFRRPVRLAFALAIAAVCACGSKPLARPPVPEPPNPFLTVKPGKERGAFLFRKACAQCHGRIGDGVGATEPGIEPPPRNLVVASYRFRSTPTGSLPTDADIARTIRGGLRGTWMPPWQNVLCPDEIDDIVAHVKSLSPYFADEDPDPPVPIPAPAPASPAAVERGRIAYVELGCAECHGDAGDGKGRVRPEQLRDDRDHPIPATDFVRGQLKAGRAPKDVYRVLVTGMDGTPMPSYAEVAAPDKLYDVVHYVLALNPHPGWPSWKIPATQFLAPCEARVGERPSPKRGAGPAGAPR